ncbi:MAG: pilus assembly protein, partial [Actinomycetota bacterium]|nr:pilus assembly protein [Actinomycetota bacterium]
SLRKSIVALAGEMGLLPVVGEKGGRAKAGQPRRLLGQSGQAAVETVGVTSLIIILALFAWQMVIIGVTYVAAGHSAREGARALSVGEDVGGTVRDETNSIWREDLEIDEGEDFVKVTLQVPLIVPGINSPFEINARSGAVLEDEPLPDGFETQLPEDES